MNTPLNKTGLQLAIERARAKMAGNVAPVPAPVSTLPVVEPVAPAPLPVVHHSNVVIPAPSTAGLVLNEQQQQAVELAMSGKSFNLIGAAGTGKTTTLKELVRRLMESGAIPPIDFDTKYLCRGLPGILLTSFTRRAVRNMRKVMSGDLQDHCVTVHKVLEYEPVFYEVLDEETQRMRNTMRFEPMRGPRNLLPSTLVTIIVDESSMLSTELFSKLLAALPSATKVQFIFVGDLYQLPPVYGQAILGFKLLELPTVELTQIYRQAAESPIISLAHRVKNGEDIPVKEMQTTQTPQGKVTIHPWKKPIDDFEATKAASAFLTKLITQGDFNEEEDVILCPQEKVSNYAFGTIEFNRVIAQALGTKRNAVVTEVIAGYLKHYYAVGDRVLVDREDAVIISISKNMKYFGKRPMTPSIELDRWGNYRKPVTEDVDDFDVDNFLDSFTLESEDKEDRKQECSHVITVRLLDSDREVSISTAGDINNMIFSYALTVHKAQGSEWRRVFFLTHQSHVVMWSRELLYTAITRAREELYMIVEPDRNAKKGTLWKASLSPRIKGKTLAEKAEFFKGKQEDYKRKEAEILASDYGTAKPVVRRPEEEGRISIPAPSAPPAPIIKLDSLVPEHFKAAALLSLKKHWDRANLIWNGKIGAFPLLTFDLQTSKAIGVARLQAQHIRLNSLWCIVAAEAGAGSALWEQMIEETMIHEICHLVAWNFSKDRGHDSGWRMAMKLMGNTPSIYADFSAFPSWAEGYKAIVEGKLKELTATMNVDATEQQLESGEEV